MAVCIRKANKQDIPQIKRMDTFGRQLNTYRGLDKLELNSKKKKEEKNYYDPFIASRKRWCYVAEDNKKIVGFILFNIEKRKPHFRIRTIGYIDLLFVEKKRRGKGISKLLMDAAYKVLRNEEVNYLKLSVHVNNPAREVWKRHGFKEYRIDMFKRL